MTGNTYLKLKLLKRKISFKALYPYKDTRKVKGFQKLSKKEISFILLNLMVLNNTKNLSNLFHCQTFLKDTTFLFKKALVDIHFLSGINLFIFLFP